MHFLFYVQCGCYIVAVNTVCHLIYYIKWFLLFSLLIFMFVLVLKPKRLANTVRRYKWIRNFHNIIIYVFKHMISSRRASNERPYFFGTENRNVALGHNMLLILQTVFTNWKLWHIAKQTADNGLSAFCFIFNLMRKLLLLMKCHLWTILQKQSLQTSFSVRQGLKSWLSM